MISERNNLEHLENLKSVLSIVKSKGLRLKLRKCVFLQPEVTYLIFRINKDGVLPLPKKVEIIKNVQVPKNVTKLKSVLDLINYYHRHLQNFIVFSGIITLFIKKRNPMEMGKKENNSFNKAREIYLYVMITKSH